MLYHSLFLFKIKFFRIWNVTFLLTLQFVQAVNECGTFIMKDPVNNTKSSLSLVITVLFVNPVIA